MNILFSIFLLTTASLCFAAVDEPKIKLMGSMGPIVEKWLSLHPQIVKDINESDYLIYLNPTDSDLEEAKKRYLEKFILLVFYPDVPAKYKNINHYVVGKHLLKDLEKMLVQKSSFPWKVVALPKEIEAHAKLSLWLDALDKTGLALLGKDLFGLRFSYYEKCQSVISVIKDNKTLEWGESYIFCDFPARFKGIKVKFEQNQKYSKDLSVFVTMFIDNDPLIILEKTTKSQIAFEDEYFGLMTYDQIESDELKINFDYLWNKKMEAFSQSNMSAWIVSPKAIQMKLNFYSKEGLSLKVKSIEYF